jgi:type IV secretory pathway VirD2 relaxase
MRKPRLVKGGEVDFKLRRHAAWLQKVGLKAGRPGRSTPRISLRPDRIYDRKSVLKASFKYNFTDHKWNGKLEGYARYIEAGHEKETGHREIGFDQDHERIDVMQTAHNWAQARDKLHWRMILGPDDADRIDLRQHVRDVMAQMERDLGTELKWCAVIHDNTDRTHAHILLRGVRQELDRDGRCVTLTMQREYVSRGIRSISEQLVQQQLGPRTEREYLEARAHGIEGKRWTEIDRAIERRLQDGVADYRFVAYLSERSRPRIQQEMERLAFLEGMGLAHRLDDNRWIVNSEFKGQLREMQLDNDVIKGRAHVHAQRREQERQKQREPREQGREL